MSEPERVSSLQYAWQSATVITFRSRVLGLFRQAAPGFADLTPTEWPAHVTVYRGAWSRSWRKAQRRLRRGFSWTTDREVAVWFASKRVPRDAIGCLGATTVARQDVIAYFTAPEGEHDGSGFYLEHECLIDPSSVSRVTYEPIERGESV